MPMRGPGRLALVVVAVVVPLAGTRAGTASDERADILAGAGLIQAYGCGACHSIPGVPNAHGLVGPPLDNIASRSIIAGKLPNTAEGLMTWLQHPQAIVPGNAMPDLGVDPDQARAMAAYLSTLR